VTDLAPTRKDVLELARVCYQDPLLFLRTFLPELFTSPFTWLHRGIVAVCVGRADFLSAYGELERIAQNFVYKDKNGEERSIFLVDGDKITLVDRQFTEIMVPRGFGKTTLVGIGLPLYDILYQTARFSAYVSEAGPHAEMQLDNVKRELVDNERILQVFGDLRPKLKDDEKWSAKMFETKTGCAFVARGRGSQIRGLNHRGFRPQKIIVDDVEDKESVQTEGQREKTRRWFYADLKPALPRVGPPGRIVVLGTLLHGEALLETLAQDPEWSVVRLSVKDKNGDWSWPEAFNEEIEEREKLSFTLAGQLSAFYMEYYNEARPEETAVFHREYFKYGRPPEGSSIVAAATYCDPAISKKRTACDCVINTVGSTEKGHLYLLDVWGKRGPGLSEVADEYFRQVRVYKPRFAGIESVAYQAALAEYLRTEMFRRGQYFEIIEVPHKSSKKERIKGGLQGRFASGYIYFTQRWPKLESQLLDFNMDTDGPDDYPDALEGAVELLNPVAGLSSVKDYEDEDDIPELSAEIGGEYNVA